MPAEDDNPYVPGFGIVPPALAGREPEAADLASALRRLRAGLYEQPRLLTGDRGMGKTALLAEHLTEATTSGNWVVDLEAGKDVRLVAALVRGLHQHLLAADRDARVGAAVSRALSVIRSLTLAHAGISLTVEVEPAAAGVADSGDLATDLSDALVATGTAAATAGAAIVLAIDEVQALPAEQTAPLFRALQATVKHDPNPELGTRLPIQVVLAGLADSRTVLKRRAGTYAERVREWPLGLLDDAAAAEALAVPARDRAAVWTSDALTVAVEAAGGYPYALQLVGYETWSAASRRHDGPAIDARDVDTGVEQAGRQLNLIYESRLDEVPATERSYLDAVAALEPADRRTSTIAERLGGRAQDWAWARSRLIDRGLLRPAGHGLVAIALPGLERHLRGSALSD